MIKNLVWFGEMERKIAKLSMTTFAYRSSSELFYVYIILSVPVPLKKPARLPAISAANIVSEKAEALKQCLVF